jgi:exonuclease SbcC
LGLYVKSQERLKEQARLKMEVEDRRNTSKGIENCIQRCSQAASALGKLKFLREYTKGFIESNISQIERFFNLLHTPREFDQLELGQDGLWLRRKWDEKPVKAYQMSSGQRASLALSVMFAIHLAAPKAPRVLMMDEPVANMDDLHLMNLLDLLRDLSLSGRQIFFTTANPDVANLFRRKFSFYHERFTHFEFMRSSGEPVRIKPIHYSPYMDTPAAKQVKKS